jgi:hypothetical protein
VRALVHIDARDLTFAEMPNGDRKANLQTVALLLDAGGKAVGQTGRADTVLLRPELFAQVLRAGLVFSVDLPLTKPGVFQVRAAVSDTASRRMGSASDVVEVPDLGEGRLALSGIVMSAVEQTRPAQEGEDAVATAESKGTLSVSGDSDGTPAVRRFRPGAQVAYALGVYNARPDPSSGQPNVEVQASLYRDDMIVAALPAVPAKVSGVGDPRRLATAGVVRLAPTMEPGYYTLAVTVTDRLARKKDAMAVQWTDFEVAAPEGL